MMKRIALALAGALTVAVQAVAAPQPRVRVLLNDGWYFENQRVSLPHTWNAHDPFDDVPGYYRGVGNYRRDLELDSTFAGKRVFLYFEGANQVADVFVNGAFAGRHRGGYTAFSFDITRFVRIGASNQIAVRVDNSHDPFIAPLSVGYALYGGIYRDVWLIATEPVHIDVTDHGSPGVIITTPNVTRDAASVVSRAVVVSDHAVRVVTTVRDGESVVARAQANGRDTVSTRLQLAQPKLWSPDTPNLYTLRTEVFDGDRLVDVVDQPLGLRWFRFDPQTGFWLNGEKLTLRGTTRHQDFEGLGSALSDAQHLRDMQIIKQMGANFVRLAHYPQDPAVLDACDRLGLLVWEEVPVVNYITPGAQFTENAHAQMRDMIRQHHNHPSVIIWGLMNEVFLWSPEGARIQTQKDTTYTRQVRDFAVGMNALAHSEDPTRPTAMAIHGSADYDKAGLTTIADVLGLNLYSGWYGGKFDDFGRTLDKRHAEHPKQVVMVSEYGAEQDYRVNSLEPERFDFSNTWMEMFHESHLQQIAARPWLAGTAIWNQFDFSQPFIGGTLPNMNQKGMLYWNRRPKSVFYLYQANWSKQPVLHIATDDWTRRAGAPNTPQPVSVFSNQKSVELFLNGNSLGAKAPDDVRTATWQVPFVAGTNTLEARAGTLVERTNVEFVAAPNMSDLAVNVGSHVQIADPDGPVWIEDQPYVKGSFGYIGGRGTQVNREYAITGTRLTPLFLSYRDSIQSYQADVADGSYMLELDFIEPLLNAQPNQRVFDVVINGSPVFHLDLSKDYGNARAVTQRLPVRAENGQGVRIDFRAIQGNAVLSGIRITRQ